MAQAYDDDLSKPDFNRLEKMHYSKLYLWFIIIATSIYLIFGTYKIIPIIIIICCIIAMYVIKRCILPYLREE